MDYFTQSRLVWTPPQKSTAMAEVLRRQINQKHGTNLKDYHDLHRYSVDNYGFWLDLCEYLRIIFSVPPTPDRIITNGNMKEIPIWFPGAKLNYAENLLHRRDDAVALVEVSEIPGRVTRVTYRQLRELVRKTASALRVNGLEVGDRVAAIVTNSVHATVIALAVASVGGIFSSTATDMGTQGILDRYLQIQPKFVFAETEVFYGGKRIDLMPKVAEVVSALAGKGLQQAILLPSRLTNTELRNTGLKKCVTLSQFIDTGDSRELVFEQLPFSQPLFILYSSGTSGKPKCIVHSAGGALVNTKKDLKHIFNLTEDDTYFQYTTTGWMMWTFMLSGLACGSRLILYDGSPFHPDVQTYLKMISDHGVTSWGTSPRFLSEVQGRGIEPLKLGSFDGLRTMCVTGAIVTPPLFEWTASAFGNHIHIVSTSGGTDICASFVTGSTSLPVYAGEIQAKALGMKVEVFDLFGKNIEHTGQPGELVCTRPHPSQPVSFWGDPSGEKLRAAYFEMFAGIWRQGDFMVVNPVTKGIMILGRSDGVLNPSGVRFGSGEIYTILEQFSEVLDDALCVGQRRPSDKDERVLLFLKMRPGCQFSPALVESVKAAIRKGLSARHVPTYVFETPEIPYTVNGKKIEIAVKQIVSGSDIVPSGTVANPGCLAFYERFRDVEKLRTRL